MSILSLYWEGAAVPPEARAAVEKLGCPKLSVEERKAALLELLASESVVARGLALDFFSVSTSSSGHGNTRIVEDAIVRATVRAAALRELAAPPYEPTDPDPDAWPSRGANHTSALHMLGDGISPADAPLLARVLRESNNPSLLFYGVRAARPVLRGEPAQRELVDVLTQIASRREVDLSTRMCAIWAIRGVADESVTPLLVASLADPELAVSAAAASCLLERDFERHRPLVAPVAAAWPTDESLLGDVREVRELLDLVPSLASPNVAESAAAARGLLRRDFDRFRPLVAPIAATWPTDDESLPWEVGVVRELLQDMSQADRNRACIASLYWSGAFVPREVRPAVEKLGTPQLPVEEKKAALLELLASDSVVARGLALDFYCLSCANLRWCDDPTIENAVVEDAVRTAALRELAAPPYEHPDPEGPALGTNHASALHALPIAGHEDASLLVRILREYSEPELLENAHPDILESGVSAAGAVLSGESAHPELAELVDVLSQISLRRRVNPRMRASAIHAIGGVVDESVTPLLVTSLADPELAVSVAAARTLLERDLERFRPLVAPIAAAWLPDDEFPLYDVHEVRRLLEEASEVGEGSAGPWGAKR